MLLLLVLLVLLPLLLASGAGAAGAGGGGADTADAADDDCGITLAVAADWPAHGCGSQACLSLRKDGHRYLNGLQHRCAPKHVYVTFECATCECSNSAAAAAAATAAAFRRLSPPFAAFPLPFHCLLMRHPL